MNAKIKIGTEVIELEVPSERDFRNDIKSCINSGSFYEYTDGNKRVLINAKNITSVELEGSKPAVENQWPVRPVEDMSPEAIRKRQEAMQPQIHEFEAKAKAMEALKKAEDEKKANAITKIYQGGATATAVKAKTKD